MKLSKKIKLEYWQARCTAEPYDNLDSMLEEALDELEEKYNELLSQVDPMNCDNIISHTLSTTSIIPSGRS